MESKIVRLRSRERNDSCQDCGEGTRGKRKEVGQGIQSFKYARWIHSGDPTYSMVTLVNNTMYLKFAKRLDLKLSHHIKKKQLCEVMDTLISWIVIIFSQCMYIKTLSCTP